MNDVDDASSGTGIRHVVLLDWVEGVTSDQIDALKAGLAELPGRVPQIAGYSFGETLGINPGTAAFGIVADFATTDDYLVYRDHPEHHDLIARLVTPIVERRWAIQFSR
jgi:hypothetical protein